MQEARSGTPAAGSVADGGIVKGQVSGMQQRYEIANQQLVWSFRVERQDESGQALPRIAVELRGVTFNGTLGNGDWVEVSGKWRDGVLRADRLRNLSTNANVDTSWYPRINWKMMRIALAVLVCFVLVMLVAFEIFSSNFQKDVQQSELKFDQDSKRDRQKALEAFCRDAPSGC